MVLLEAEKVYAYFPKSTSDLDRILEENENVVLAFMADWCGPCKRMINDHAKGNINEVYVARGITPVYVDVEKLEITTRHYRVFNIPVHLAIKEGKVVGEHVGGMNAECFTKKLVEWYGT